MVIAGCSSSDRYTIQKLPNGKEIKIISIGKIFSTKEREGTSLFLRYESDYDIDDKAAIKNEVETIWPVFKVNVENEKIHSAIIQASNTGKKYFIFPSVRNYGFIYRKNEEGQWEVSE